MASLHVVFAIDEASKKHCNVSPKNSKKAWFPPHTTCGHGQHNPKCVCAPTTHPGSFRCRLHRVNSHDRSSPTSPLHQPPVQSPPASKTVEAQ